MLKLSLYFRQNGEVGKEISVLSIIDLWIFFYHYIPTINQAFKTNFNQSWIEYETHGIHRNQWSISHKPSTANSCPFFPPLIRKITLFPSIYRVENCIAPPICSSILHTSRAMHTKCRPPNQVFLVQHPSNRPSRYGGTRMTLVQHFCAASCHVFSTWSVMPAIATWLGDFSSFFNINKFFKITTIKFH